MLIGVTTCLNYSSHLKKTLHHNIEFFDKFYIITSKNDTQTIDLCKDIEKIVLIKTEVFFDKNAPFYKSKALNLVLDTLVKGEDIWCAIMDADVILPIDFKQIDFKKLDKDCIYSYKRDKGVSEHNGYVIGYFQLFNIESKYYNFNYDLMFRTAAGSDLIFSIQWPQKNNIFFKQGEIKHVALSGKDWCGVYNSPHIIERVNTLQQLKSMLFMRELRMLEEYKVKSENFKKQLNIPINLKTQLSNNDEDLKRNIKTFIKQQERFISKMQNTINTHYASVQELSELLNKI